MVDKALHRWLKIEQHKLHYKPGKLILIQDVHYNYMNKCASLQLDPAKVILKTGEANIDSRCTLKLHEQMCKLTVRPS
jgi:hypothetical protein